MISRVDAGQVSPSELRFRGRFISLFDVPIGDLRGRVAFRLRAGFEVVRAYDTYQFLDQFPRGAFFAHIDMHLEAEFGWVFLFHAQEHVFRDIDRHHHFLPYAVPKHLAVRPLRVPEEVYAAVAYAVTDDRRYEIRRVQSRFFRIAADDHLIYGIFLYAHECGNASHDFVWRALLAGGALEYDRFFCFHARYRVQDTPMLG